MCKKRIEIVEWLTAIALRELGRFTGNGIISGGELDAGCPMNCGSMPKSGHAPTANNPNPNHETIVPVEQTVRSVSEPAFDALGEAKDR